MQSSMFMNVLYEKLIISLNILLNKSKTVSYICYIHFCSLFAIFFLQPQSFYNQTNFIIENEHFSFIFLFFVPILLLEFIISKIENVCSKQIMERECTMIVIGIKKTFCSFNSIKLEVTGTFEMFFHYDFTVLFSR